MSAADAGYVVAVDQGTSSTKAIAVRGDGRVARRVTVPVGQSYPRPGWVEHDPEELLGSVVTALTEVATGLDAPVAAVGLSAQRESAVLWDHSDRRALGPVVSWQDRRTADRAARLRSSRDRVRELSGLPVDPMFSALKIGWLLDTAAVRRPGLTAGTIDAWLVARLTGDRRIEVGNASRTQLLNVETASWDPELLQTFQVPAAVLPEVTPSDRPTGPIAGVAGLEGVRVQAVLADSHAALYAHGVRTPGQVKVTYGTGSSVLGLVGDHASQVAGLVRTIAWATPHPVAAREGNILSTGGTVTWLAELLGVTPGEVFTLARTAPSDHGVDIVPAFAGLAAPWWDEHAVAIISGFTRGSGRPALARAALESIALQVEDLATRFGARTLIADGGPASDDFLMQLQADLSRRTVHRSDVPELSALGAAHLAGIVAGVWTGAGVAGFPRPRTTFEPAGAPEVAHRRRQRWHEAIAQSRYTKENHD